MSQVNSAHESKGRFGKDRVQSRHNVQTYRNLSPLRKVIFWTKQKHKTLTSNIIQKKLRISQKINIGIHLTKLRSVPSFPLLLKEYKRRSQLRYHQDNAIFSYDTEIDKHLPLIFPSQSR